MTSSTHSDSTRPRLRAPAEKVIPFLEQLHQQGTELAAVDPPPWDETRAWCSRTFRALTRAFVDPLPFTRPYNAAGVDGYPDALDSPATKHRRAMVERLSVLTEAIIAAKADRRAPGTSSSDPRQGPDARA